MNINQELTLNLSADGIPPRLHMVQGDANTRTVVATLWDGAQPYTVPAASAVMIRFRKPDGTGGLYDTTESGAQVTVSGNTVTAPVATQMLAVAGVVQAQVDIYGTATGKAEEKLATFRFAVEVAPSVYPDAEIISSDYFNIIAADIGKAVEAAARAEAAQAAASAAQQGAETARDDAVNAKTAAESAKTAAVAAQEKSEAAQTKAETAQTAAEQSAAAAQTAKEGAETAQSGAQAAQTAAESAKAAAQTAQTGAETARAGAEAATGAAEGSAEDAEAWAVGQRNGTDVPSTDPAYHNNARYYKDQAQTIAGGEFVSYGAPQSLTDAQKQQARDNIGAPAPYEAGDNISITGRIITTKAFPCNPKITDNGYFVNPVNQRGQTSYAGTGYTIDRWRLFLSGSVAVSDGGLQLNSAINFGQTLEGSRVPDGIKTTASVLTNEGLAAVAFTLTGEAQQIFRATVGGITLYFTGNWNNSGSHLIMLDGTALVKAVKLELGSQQTLAHQEYGEWVLNEIPNYGEQLRRCQRYYQRLKASSGYMRFGISQPYTDVAAGVFIPLQGEMRTAPTMSSSGNFALFGGGTFHGVNLSLDTASPYNVILKATGTGLPGVSSQLLVNADTNAYIEFSADL